MTEIEVDTVVGTDVLVKNTSECEMDLFVADVNILMKAQKQFFESNQTKAVNFRIQKLKKLKEILKKNEDKLYKAIHEDFGKSSFETYTSELSLVYHELNKNIRNIRKWSRKKRVSTGLANFPARSYIIPEPLGNILVIGAWNYPYQVSLIPAISALAAGNTVILKPSELASKTSAVMAELINGNFASNYFHVVEGSVEITGQLLKQKFDKIFFTGSTRVGKIIYEAAAKQMTPLTLELGGKSPTFVLADCNIKITVKRLVWAKFLNAGQTCVAPDYVLVEQSIEKKFLGAMVKEIEKYHKKPYAGNENYVSIINKRNFDRLNSFIDIDKLFYGGVTDREKRLIGPTVLNDVSFNDEVMKDEIFGPLMPVISFTDLDEAISKVKSMPKPLSCYIYSGSRKKIKKILNEISFGGGAVNESIMQLTNSNLPFGGVGLSGTGQYHGKYGFDNFTHLKAVMDKPVWFESGLKYAPYSALKMKLIKMLLE
jgi:aldehyde dehydrogenase (NAD+)